MANITVIILTYNEERHIERAIASVRGFAKDVIVVDSFSSDRTVSLAKNSGAIVLQNEFINHSKQFQWALEHSPISTEWIMRLDADEVVERYLATEIESKLARLPDDVVGIGLKRKHIFMGRWIRYGGRYPLVLLRIWRRGHGRIEDRWMDEHIVVWGGGTIIFDGDFCDHNLGGLSLFIDKHNSYATKEAIEKLNGELKLFDRDVAVELGASTAQARLRRLLKEKIFNHLPFEIATVLYFLYRYLLLLGFLDGAPGTIYHVLQGFWYRFLVGAKCEELRAAVSNLTDKNEIKAELSRRTGLRLE